MRAGGGGDRGLGPGRRSGLNPHPPRNLSSVGGGGRIGHPLISFYFSRRRGPQRVLTELTRNRCQSPPPRPAPSVITVLTIPPKEHPQGDSFWRFLFAISVILEIGKSAGGEGHPIHHPTPSFSEEVGGGSTPPVSPRTSLPRSTPEATASPQSNHSKV